MPGGEGYVKMNVPRLRVGRGQSRQGEGMQGRGLRDKGRHMVGRGESCSMSIRKQEAYGALKNCEICLI